MCKCRGLSSVLSLIPYSSLCVHSLHIQVVKFGKEKAATNTEQKEEDDEAKTIGSKLQELMEENEKLERLTSFCSLLKKKKAWVVYDIQVQHFNSLNDAYVILNDQFNEVQSQLKRFEEMLVAKISLKGAW